MSILHASIGMIALRLPSSSFQARFSNSSLVMLNRVTLPFLDVLDTNLWKVSPGSQCQSSSRMCLEYSSLDSLRFSLLVRNEHLVSEAVLEWFLDAQKDESNVVFN